MTESLSFLQRFVRLGATHPLPCLAFLFAVSVAAALGLPRLSIDVGSTRLIPADHPDRQAHLRVAREFGSDNRSFVFLRDTKMWTAAKLQSFERLHGELQKLPFVERVDDLFTAIVVRRIDGQLQAKPLLGLAPVDDASAEHLRTEVLADPLAVHHLLSEDGQALVIGLSIREEQRDAKRIDEYGAVERTINRYHKEFESIVQVGSPRIEAEIESGIAADARILVPVTAVLVMATMFLFFRSVFAALMPLIVSAISLLWTFGLMGWMGLPVTILSGMLPTITMVIGTTELMRMTSGYFSGLNVNQLEVQGSLRIDATEARKRATNTMLMALGAPAFLTVVTTSIGFGSNAFSNLATIRDFGLAAAFAILANGLVTILLVPLLYKTYGPLTSNPRAFSGLFGLPGMAARAFGVMRQRFTIVAMIVAAGLVAFFAQQAANLSVTNEPMSFFRHDRPVVTSTEQMQKAIAGPRIFYVTLESNAEGAFKDPANLRRLEEIQAFIEKQEIFDRSLSLADIVGQANMAANGGKPDVHRVPYSRAQISRYLLLHSPLDLAPYVSHDYRRANIVVFHNVADSSTLNRYVRELREAVSAYAGVEMTSSIVGENLMINAAADRLVDGQLMAFVFLLLVVFVVMSLMFTSVKGGLISLVPSVIPILLTLVVMQALQIPLNAATVLVAVVAVGIAIDGTIHLFSRYSELCRNATSYDEAVIETIKDEAASVIAVGIALALGFGVLLLSNFTPIAQFGALAALTMLFSIFTNLLITPLVLSQIRLVGLYEILSMSKQRAALEHSPLFYGMTGYQIRKTILISELLEHKDGEHLIEQGTVGRSMYLVVSGRLDVVRHDGDGERVLASLGPGDVIGEIGFVRATHRTADVRAVGPGSVLRFDHNRLEKDLAFFPHIMAKLNFNISGILGQRLAELVEADHSK